MTPYNTDKSKILVLIPARNEEKTIKQVVEDILKQGFPVLVIDDGSTDLTVQQAQKAGAYVISLINPLGTWGALQTGFRYAKDKGYEIVVTFDADGQHNPSFINTLIEPVISGKVDVSIGTYPERLSKVRKLALHFFRSIARISFHDLTSGMRVYGRRALEILADERATIIDYQDIGVLMLLLGNNLTMQEFPVKMNHRVSGKSRIFHSWFAVAKYVFYSFMLVMGKSKIWSRINRS